MQAVGFKKFFKESVLLVTAGGDDFSQPVEWYKRFEKYLDWKNLGEVLGIENIDQARVIGAEIQ
ncbi:hypothetical protein [Companilactobacillus furfuricola]|uniref:hypothetical protein n=1 Tax=Companilactobacillus furfuricola TaxID=1462575 RepID=UPI0013DDCD29|nr:hypothetical protein [Companilactobacillus furfuricola]